MNTRIILLIAILTTFISCNKNNDLLDLNGEYRTDTNASITSVRMFTGNGEVTDIDIIREYLEKKGTLIFDFERSTSFSSNPVTLTITDNNQVLIANHFPTILKSEIISRTTSELLIAHMDSIYIPLTGGLIPSNRFRCDTLSRFLKVIDPPRVDYRFSYGTGIGDFYMYRPMFPVRIKNGRLFLPLITLAISSSVISPTLSSYCSQSGKDEWNYFNSNGIGLLQTSDTIVYQEREVAFIKQ